MADLHTLFGLPQPAEKEIDAPAVSLSWALIFQQLGGSLGIGSDGRRHTTMPEPALFRSRGEELPSVPDPEPHERFLNGDEWRGAIKLMAALIRRTSDADKDLIFGLLAPVVVDEGRLVPSIEEPQRRSLP